VRVLVEVAFDGAPREGGLPGGEEAFEVSIEKRLLVSDKEVRGE
jgi:hypothetical protein